MTRVVIAVDAERELLRVPPRAYRALVRAFEALAADPFDPGAGYRVKQLRERGGRWVVRLGTWGAIYRVEGNELRILKIGPRSTLYRGR